MTNSFPPGTKERNPITYKLHRVQTAWQIYLPLIMGLMIAVAFAVLAGFASAEGSSRWADISLIFLIIPVVMLTLLVLALTAGLIYIVVKLLQIIPVYSYRALDFIQLVSRRIHKVADLAVEPILRVHGFKAALQVLRAKLRS
jgi:predicted PurR-regulated permease PerM